MSHIKTFRSSSHIIVKQFRLSANVQNNKGSELSKKSFDISVCGSVSRCRRRRRRRQRQQLSDRRRETVRCLFRRPVHACRYRRHRRQCVVLIERRLFNVFRWTNRRHIVIDYNTRVVPNVIFSSMIFHIVESGSSCVHEITNLGGTKHWPLNTKLTIISSFFSFN